MKEQLKITLTYQGGKFYKAIIKNERLSKEELGEIMGVNLPYGNIKKEVEQWVETQTIYEVDYFGDFDVS